MPVVVVVDMTQELHKPHPVAVLVVVVQEPTEM
jgi:hypothetical protein